jgi:hypothetical protein
MSRLVHSSKEFIQKAHIRDWLQLRHIETCVARQTENIETYGMAGQFMVSRNVFTAARFFLIWCSALFFPCEIIVDDTYSGKIRLGAIES